MNEVGGEAGSASIEFRSDRCNPKIRESKCAAYPKFKNDRGLPEVLIGVKEFNCTGVGAPHDHPHIYLNMGRADSIICPYCATRFRYNADLGSGAIPADSVFDE